MSWTDEEIDNLAKESAANSSFDYKDDYWKEFEAMLPKSRGKDFAWFFTAFLFVGLLSTSLVLKEFVRNDSSNVVADQKGGIPEDVIGETNEQTSKKSTEKSIERSTAKESQDGYVNEESSSQFSSRKNTILSENKPKVVSSKQQNSNDSRVNGERFDATRDDLTLDNTLLLDEPSELPNDNLTAVSGELAREVNNEMFENETNVSNKGEIIESGAVSKLPLLELVKPVDADIIPMSLHNERELPARASFYVGAFGGLSESLITPSKDVSTSFGLGIGAQIQKGRFTFTTGLNGVWSNHKDLTLTRSGKIYGFGSSKYSYEFRYKQIYTLEAELSAGYKFGRHLVNVGVRPSIIIGTKVGLSESIGDESTIDRNEYGHVNGLKRFGVKPMIGYSFDVTSSLKLGVNVGVELMPKIQDGFLEGNSNSYPIDGQIYLRHSIKFKR